MDSTTSSTETKEPRPLDSASTVAICLGGILALIIIVFALYIFLRKRHKLPQRDIQRDIEGSKGVRNDTMDLQTLDVAIPTQTYVQSKAELEGRPSWALHRSASSEVCAICIGALGDQDDVRRLECRHVFHASCINPWFQAKHFECPLCKTVYISKAARGSEA